MFGRLITHRAVAAVAALTLLAAGAVGAGAAGGANVPGPVNDVLSKVGISNDAQSPQSTDNHGSAVSDGVHQAIATTTPGPERGVAVSEAACEAAHDRSTLPQGAQDAPGQADKEPKDCTHPNADGTPGAGNDQLPGASETPETDKPATVPTNDHGHSSDAPGGKPATIPAGGGQSSNNPGQGHKP
ncbi:MAG TPA: hypothetical protein VJB57_00120 [Dehalococcoidia bacterium]|nr:hypothetical protein [Dehalococcoidia bacterium]